MCRLNLGCIPADAATTFMYMGMTDLNLEGQTFGLKGYCICKEASNTGYQNVTDCVSFFPERVNYETLLSRVIRSDPLE